MSEHHYLLPCNDNNPSHTILLDKLIVRPVLPEERLQWDTLMSLHHYLGFQGIVGESIRYVAIIDGRWVALIGWGAAAFKSCHRDKWIGWHPAIKWQRLKWVANNVRFLILPDIHVKNLASKVLALNMRRLSLDWQERFGHSILLVETFVDSSRFRGTCYLAAGWLPLGQTRGFGRNGGKYYHHGRIKMIFIRPLKRDAICLLSDPRPHPTFHRKEIIVDITALSSKQLDSLIEHLVAVPDYRMKRGVRHRKIVILSAAVCAVLSGARTISAISEWVSIASQSMLRRFGCRRVKKIQSDKEVYIHIPPSEPTIRRLLQRIDAEAVDAAINGWLSEVGLGSSKGNSAVAIDGKTVRGSASGDSKAIQLFSAFTHKDGIVIAQRQVDTKSNEITAAAPTLKDIDLQGVTVTADALHTQKDLARFLVKDKGADYLFTVKDNQATLKDDISILQMEAFPPSA